ncbi:hypothetical protein [Kitasatospora sp. LaBMicrA B282]|uniref:hypothetical protein n=1 Tax=Kitasatospora sp. LaBMicrA B282 TaxID=3420949 RepID=UPI003D11CFB1
MLEFGFGIADMANVRFSVSPMDQILGAAARSEHSCIGTSINHARWWRQAKRHVPRRAAPLFDLVNASFRGIPDFLDIEGCHRLTDSLDAILAVPETLLHADLASYDLEPKLPRVVAELRDAGPRQLRRIADGAWALFRACLEPDWPDIQRLLQSDIADHARTAAESGTGSMLDRLHPKLAWREEGVLQYATPELDATCDLGGRGLQLRPSFFLQDGIVAIPDERRPTALLYPIGTRRTEQKPTDRDGLADLIGPAEPGPCVRSAGTRAPPPSSPNVSA